MFGQVIQDAFSSNNNARRNSTFFALPLKMGNDKEFDDYDEFCVAEFKYASQNADELSLVKGQKIALLSKEVEDPGWWKGKTADGKVGVFPNNFVKLLPKRKKTPPPRPPPVTNKPKNSRPKSIVASLVNEMNNNAEAASKPEVPSQTAKPKVKDEDKVKKPLRVKVKDDEVKVKGDEVKVKEEEVNEDDKDSVDLDDVVPTTPVRLTHPTAGRARPQSRRPPSTFIKDTVRKKKKYR